MTCGLCPCASSNFGWFPFHPPEPLKLRTFPPVALDIYLKFDSMLTVWNSTRGSIVWRQYETVWVLTQYGNSIKQYERLNSMKGSTVCRRYEIVQDVQQYDGRMKQYKRLNSMTTCCDSVKQCKWEISTMKVWYNIRGSNSLMAVWCSTRSSTLWR